jgi:hypothetical protein
MRNGRPDRTAAEGHADEGPPVKGATSSDKDTSSAHADSTTPGAGAVGAWDRFIGGVSALPGWVITGCQDAARLEFEAYRELR